MENLEITGGDEAADSGGGIYIYNASGVVTLTAVLQNLKVTNNSARSAGGISSSLSNPSSRMTIENSTISDNTADYGGGLSVNEGGAGTIISSSTISGNTATYQGGGLYQIASRFRLSNSTVSGNSAPTGGGIYYRAVATSYISSSTITKNSGYGIYAVTGIADFIYVHDSIIAGNIGNNDCYALYSILVSHGYNLVGNVDGDNFGGGPTTGDQFGSRASGTIVHPFLSTLGYYGGRIETHRLKLGSPAIDAGDPAGCTDADGVLLTPVVWRSG